MSYEENSSRYPYTYACDWVRTAGLAESRADASKVIKRIATHEGVEVVEVAKRLADEYCQHYNALEALERFKDRRVIHLKELVAQIPAEGEATGWS